MTPRAHRSRRGLAAAMLVPGAAVATLVALLPEDGRPSVPAGPGAPALARLADLPPPRPHALRPVVALGGPRGSRHLERLAGGIRPARPRRIRIPAVQVDASVEAVRARRGGIEVPRRGRAGWYRGGARPGEAGRAVVIGHLDSSDGPSVFARVPELGRGALVEVVDERGAVHGYRVVGATRVRKNRFPTGAVYGHARHPVLVLVTCGGPYIEGRGYRDNVLVYARSA